MRKDYEWGKESQHGFLISFWLNVDVEVCWQGKIKNGKFILTMGLV